MGDRREPGKLPPREAVERYLQRRRADATEATISSWRYRLKLWVEWCEGRNIDHVEDLRRLDFDEYHAARSGADVEPSTLEGEMWTLKKLIEYLEQLGAVETGLSEAVRIPNVSDDDLSNDARLEAGAAIPLLHHYREDPAWRGKRNHVFLELAWNIGARIGGIVALDLRDVDLDERYVEFHHRPETGTPLKNKLDGERPVAIQQEVADVLRRYIDHHRHDVHDDHGREPLLPSQVGRPDPNTIRVWSYQATQPCVWRDCPHGKERESCEWTKYAHASKCPSSRSPHKIRTGSISWQLDQGVPPQVVAERVNASLDVIERHYDKTEAIERMERRRRQHIENLDLAHDTNE